MSSAEPIRVLFVCLGNICRSPTAEAVMRALCAQHGVQERFFIDSAGTGAWHAGEPPDRRSAAVGARRGMPLTGRARQVTKDDFTRFDYLLAMDRTNRDELLALAPSAEAREKVALLRGFDPQSPPQAEVPDPYYGGPEGFDHVFDICVAACEGLLRTLTERPGLPSAR